MHRSQVGTAGSRKFAWNLGKTTEKTELNYCLDSGISNKILAYSRTKGLKLLLSRKSVDPYRSAGGSFWYLGDSQIIWAFWHSYAYSELIYADDLLPFVISKKLRLGFKFPYYGHYLDSVVLTTGGEM